MAEDIELYFTWANDPDVRRNAFNQNPILFADHRKWFENKLQSASSFLYVLEKDGRPAGQIRFDATEENVFEIDFSIDRNFRGQGLGAHILKRGMQQFSMDIASLPDAGAPILVKGIVKYENTASCRAFLRAGFEEEAYHRTEDKIPPIRVFHKFCPVL